jgi:hypothetical protein
MSRLRATSLDRKLAAGTPPMASRILAARAGYLLSASYRRQLATYWSERVASVAKPVAGISGRVPLCGDRILAAQDELRGLVSALTAAAPPNVRGVASARILLTDGLGPLYNRRNTTDLGMALRDAAVRMG